MNLESFNKPISLIHSKSNSASVEHSLMDRLLFLDLLCLLCYLSATFVICHLGKLCLLELFSELILFDEVLPFAVVVTIVIVTYERSMLFFYILLQAIQLDFLHVACQYVVVLCQYFFVFSSQSFVFQFRFQILDLFVLHFRDEVKRLHRQVWVVSSCVVFEPRIDSFRP